MNRVLSLAFVSAALLSACTATPTPEPKTAAAAPAEIPATLPGRLPFGTEPVHYTLTVAPDAPNLAFTGSVAIDIDVQRASDSLTLNAADLTIDRATIDGAAVKSTAVDAAAQTVTFTFAEPLSVGRHKLAVDYKGKIYKSAAGLFALDYEGPSGPQRMLATQMEPADARRLAPMWDEPARKATWDVAVSVPAGQMAVSNMPVTGTEKQGDRTLFKFATTPKMSSYLLFVGAGDLERIATKVGDVEVGVVTRRGASEQGRYALQAAAELLPYYNDYFGTPYPLPKLDMIAGPGTSQFFGAMENWGAILYFERRVLIDPSVSTESDRQQAYATIAHEIAHQWFGNIVTMRWWDDLWLNEGFASWMEGKASTHFHPEWNVWAQTVGGSKESGLGLDARSTTHPIIQSIATVDQMNQAFDSITYQKGEAVIRMLEESIGDAPFRTGVQRYMAKYAYANTETDQLWAELEAASGRPVVDIMHDFTLQGGVPLIRVSDATCAAGATTATLAQERFGVDAASKAPLSWRVPVVMKVVGRNEEARALVSGPAAQPAQVAGCGTLLVNSGQAGYFRTLYAAPLFGKLKADYARLPLVDQVGLLADTYALGTAGYQPATDALDLMAATPRNADFILWREIADRVGAIDGYLAGSRSQPAYRQWARRLLKPVFDRVGWAQAAGQSDSAALAREMLITTLGKLEDPAVLAEARRRFDGWLADPASLPATIRRPAMTAVARTATTAQWQLLRERAVAAKNPLERQMLFQMLGETQNEALARQALALSIAPETPATSGPAVIRAVSGNFPELAFDFVLANRAAINERVEAASQASFIPELGAATSDPKVAAKVRAWVEANLPKESRGDAEVALAGAAVRAEARGRVVPQVEAWLRR
jgi:aminopeptidase N